MYTKYQNRINSFLQTIITKSSSPTDLAAAIKYSLLNPGKRLRATLVYIICEILEVPTDEANIIAASIEMVHAFSLIHDDLPAMDNDELRRGLPTCHIKFNEAIAILAGDSLLTEAFNLLATNNTKNFDSTARLNLVRILSEAIGYKGMAEGQALDMASENKNLTPKELSALHSLKTGKLITACALMPLAVSKYKNDAKIHQALLTFSSKIGLAFQIQDDILDATATSATLGKTAAKDEKSKKATYVTLLGLQLAKTHALKAHNEAIDAINIFGKKADSLKEYANLIINRNF